MKNAQSAIDLGMVTVLRDSLGFRISRQIVQACPHNQQKRIELSRSVHSGACCVCLLPLPDGQKKDGRPRTGRVFVFE
jgi:hypothetical protein